MTLRDGALFRCRQGPGDAGQNAASSRYFDARFGTHVIMVLPGRHYVTARSDEMIVTLLGSCIAACIRDPVAAIGGLNHFLLPESESGRWGGMNDAAMRYGNHAMETLINDIIGRGGQRARLEVKIFGGAQIIGRSSATSGCVGRKNIEFIRRYLDHEGIDIAAQHLGGLKPRRIHYFPVTGRVQMRQLQRESDKELFKREEVFLQEIDAEGDGGDVELFD